jgi:hypothetical protein
MPKPKEPTVKILVSHMEKLAPLRSHACWMLFTILLFENIKSRGKPFTLPSGVAGSSKGLSRANLSRALHQLEECGLISIRRQAPKPPLIAIL